MHSTMGKLNLASLFIFCGSFGFFSPYMCMWPHYSLCAFLPPPCRVQNPRVTIPSDVLGLQIKPLPIQPKLSCPYLEWQVLIECLPSRALTGLSHQEQVQTGNSSFYSFTQVLFCLQSSCSAPFHLILIISLFHSCLVSPDQPVPSQEEARFQTPCCTTFVQPSFREKEQSREEKVMLHAHAVA